MCRWQMENDPRPRMASTSSAEATTSESFSPFEDFPGLVRDVNVDSRTLRVTVEIFGRDTDVDLDFTQVKRLEPDTE
jgi:hypothetical protein